MSKINWTEEFNNLPIETRRIASVIIGEARIQQLEFERAFLKQRYLNRTKQINETIEVIRKSIEDQE